MKYLDSEEKELEKSLEGIDPDGLKPPSKTFQKNIKKAALDHINNESKMNIRIDASELKRIKKYAAKEGLKYQTFVKSVVHKYITGRLVDKERG
jgi:predicted DNA binding CopG/RHH family protein